MDFVEIDALIAHIRNSLAFQLRYQ